MTSVNHPSIATSALTCTSNPEQHEGTLTDGRCFYFRYRWGHADLGVGADPDTAVDDSVNHQRRIGESGFEGEFATAQQRDAAFAALLTVAAEMGA